MHVHNWSCWPPYCWHFVFLVDLCIHSSLPFTHRSPRLPISRISHLGLTQVDWAYSLGRTVGKPIHGAVAAAAADCGSHSAGRFLSLYVAIRFCFYLCVPFFLHCHVSNPPFNPSASLGDTSQRSTCRKWRCRRKCPLAPAVHLPHHTTMTGTWDTALPPCHPPDHPPSNRPPETREKGLESSYLTR